MSDAPKLPSGDFNMPPGVSASDIPGNGTPEPSRLWQHMDYTHGLVLTQSEEHDILSAACATYDDERIAWSQRVARLEDALRGLHEAVRVRLSEKASEASVAGLWEATLKAEAALK